MNKAHYIIFHPDSSRDKITVSATARVGTKISTNWTGNIYVDKIGIGNEDPVVFNHPWIYSYCHASQLRRNVRNDSYLQPGSTLIFASGQQANKGIRCVDTFFIIGKVHEWINHPLLQLPVHYQEHFQNNKSNLWRRHFRYPFHGSHSGVSHTYEASLWEKEKKVFSFLPVDNNGERASVPFHAFTKEVSDKVAGKVKGKYPVLLTGKELSVVTKPLEKHTVTKVLCNITTDISVIAKKGKC